MRTNGECFQKNLACSKHVVAILRKHICNGWYLHRIAIDPPLYYLILLTLNVNSDSTPLVHERNTGTGGCFGEEGIGSGVRRWLLICHVQCTRKLTARWRHALRWWSPISNVTDTESDSVVDVRLFIAPSPCVISHIKLTASKTYVRIVFFRAN